MNYSSPAAPDLHDAEALRLDDVQFAALWPATHRRHLPTVICHHLCAAPPKLGENWDGRRKQPRFKRA